MHLIALANRWVNGEIHRTMLDGCARGICAEVVTGFPVVRRPDWAGNKSPPAIRADIVQESFDAATTENAFKLQIIASVKFGRSGTSRTRVLVRAFECIQ
jgi:hypothetical protein